MFKEEAITQSLENQAALLRRGDFTALELAEATLAHIKRVDPEIGAYLLVDEEDVLGQARKLDEQGHDGDKCLWGVPIAIKDALSTKNLATTAASKILENFIPIYDAFAVRKLREAGAVILGKTNMDEFAMGSTTENSAFKTTSNPWNTRKIPGGSSGGSAAAVAAFECAGALGSDTGGSIRQPAAFCGCVGLKPTYGRVSRYGLFAYGSSLDQIGPMCRTVRDCALMLNVIAGHDKRDNTSSPRPVENYLPENEGGLSGLKIGYPPAFFNEGLDADTHKIALETLALFRSSGVELVEISLPDSNIAIAAYYIIAMAEASSNLARYDGVRYGRRAAGVTDLRELYELSRSEGFGSEVKRRIMLGSFILSSGYYDDYFRKAALTRRLIYDKYLGELSKCDFMLMPVSPVVAWEKNKNLDDPLKTYLMDAFTVPINLAGLPAISLPAGVGSVSGMPVGLQLIGKPFAEKNLLEAAAALEAFLPPLPLPDGLRKICEAQ